MNTTKATLRSRGGFSLIEVMIAGAIMAFISIAAMTVVMSASNAAAKNTLTGELETRGRDFVERCRSQFLTARFRDSANDTLGLYINQTFLWYQLPVAVNNTGSSAWGFSRDIGFNDTDAVGRSCVLRFEAETVLRESASASIATQPAGGPTGLVLPALPALEYPTPRNIDINRDGDLLDTFVRGRVMQYILDASQAVVTKAVFSNDVMLAVTGGNQFNGDFDGLTSTLADQDFLFRWVDKDGATYISDWPNSAVDNGGRAVVVSVWHGTYSDDGKMFYVRRTSEAIRFQNAQ